MVLLVFCIYYALLSGCVVPDLHTDPVRKTKRYGYVPFFVVLDLIGM
jgi:hypothetical protein